MKTALITGGAGFVGRHMTAYLRELGWDVRATDVLTGTDGAPNYLDRKRKFDLVIHAAARGPHRKAIDIAPTFFPYNVGLDAHMIHWVAASQQPRFVYLSSSAVYPKDLQTEARGGGLGLREQQAFDGPPFDRYGEAKRMGEKMCEVASECGTKVTIVRPFSGYGSDQSKDFPFGAFLERARRHDDPFKIWGDAQQVRDWIHIDDICAGILALVDAEVTVPVNLCTGRGITMFDLARLMQAQAGYTGHIETDTHQPMGVFHRVGDPSLMLNWFEPKITIAQGVARALKEQ